MRDYSKSKSQQTGQPFGVQRKPPPNYGSRREQFRLFILCAMLMLVLVMMNEARKPTTWAWLWAGQEVSDAKEDVPIDTRIEIKEVSLPQDGFIAEKSSEKTLSTVADDDYQFLPEITPDLLSSIQDNTVFRAAESPAWKTILATLTTHSDEEIRERSIGEVGFAQLFRQMDFYRGKVVTVRGIARRLEQITSKKQSSEVSLGLGQPLFRWILQPRSAASSPMVVYTLTCPDGLTPRDDMQEFCEFDGVCFKRWAYQAADGTRVAPLLLAKSCKWQPPPPTQPLKLPSKSFVLFGALGILALAIGFATFVYRTSNVKRAEIDRLRIPEEPLDKLKQESSILPSATESLRALEEEPS